MLENCAIDKIGVSVANYSKSLSFFKNILGLEPIWESEEDKNAAFRVQYNLLIIQEDPKQVSPGGLRLYFTIPNISQLRERLIEAGVMCSIIQDFGDFKIVDFSDIDGNRFALLEPSKDYIPQMEEFLQRKITL
jgi:catechol 2,3-dioxygenase-like lactoylglutathione lyase family enzyme